jgi:hypothetical protein
VIAITLFVASKIPQRLISTVGCSELPSIEAIQLRFCDAPNLLIQLRAKIQMHGTAKSPAARESENAPGERVRIAQIADNRPRLKS